MKLLKTTTFIRTAKNVIKKRPAIYNEITYTLNQLAENPLNPELKTHKLKVNIPGALACSVNYEIRIVFEIIKAGDKTSKYKEDVVLLEAIGTHDEVY